jgi:general secretion pathway protein D
MRPYMGTGLVKGFGSTIFMVMVVLLAGCATDMFTEKRQGPDSVSPEKKLLVSGEAEPEGEKLIVQKGHAYRLVHTPFGYMRQEVETPQGRSPMKAPFESASLEAKKDTSGVHAPEREKQVPVKPEPAPEPGPRPAEETKEPRQDQQPGILLNFDDADIYEVIRVIADLLKINYIVDPGVQGKVTIHTAGTLSHDDLWPVFHRILEVNGLTVVRQKGLYRVVSLKDASGLPIPSQLGVEQEGIPPAERVVIQIIPVKHIVPGEMVKLLTPFLSANGTMVSRDESNVIVVVDRGANILKIVKMVEAFDLDLFERFHYHFYELVYADAHETAETLDSLLYPVRKKTRAELKIIGIERLNLLLVMSSTPRVFEEIDRIVAKLDVPSEKAEPGIYVYSVKNGEANQLAEILNLVFSEGPSGTEQNKPAKKEAVSAKPPLTGTPLEKEVPQKTALPAAAKSREIIQGLGSGTLRGKIRIVPDEVRNALIIEAIPVDYKTIKSVLDQIDVLPRQVLIELTIAEISLDEDTDLGVEWSYKKGSGGAIASSLLSASMGSSGLQYTIGETDRWFGILSALASRNKINILASPSLLASDNKEAVIDISTEIPVASSEYQYTSGTEPMIQTNIQYRDTGLILTITPHINERRLVTMDIDQEFSDQSHDVLVGGKTYPSFFKRSVNTTLTVKHGQTIVIGGLMKQSKADGESGVPWLVKIPVLGFLFGKKTASFAKSELILLITPHVITTLEDVDEVTDEFKTKVRNVMSLVL